MKYQELKDANKKLERQVGLLYRQQQRNEQQYIREHEPFKARRYQILSVRLRVTKETRDRLTEYGRKMKKNQLGREYVVSGCFIGWYINEEKGGELRPCFFGGITYSRFDEILSIEIAEQVDGHCSKCRRYKDGLCYRNGGMDLSKKCADHKVEETDFTCPKYEEKTELWSWDREKHYPNVTVLKHEKPVKYRIYAINWGTYTEWEEKEIKSMYRFKP